jgi:hypothetical protein
MNYLIAAAASVALLTPGAALAQVAAGAVPNSFDRPGQAAPQPAPAAPPALSQTPANAESEDILRGIIAGLQAGTTDYSVMSDDLADKVREQAPAIKTLLDSLGAVQAVDFAGSQSGADLYVVNFANAQTDWIIGINEAGKVAALLFRPSEDAAPPAAQPTPGS